MKKVTRKGKRRFSIWIIIIIVIISYLGVFVYDYWSKIMTNYKEKEVLENKYKELLAKEEELNTEANKLKDPDYVAKYAREKYMYSKDGEYIIRIKDN